jgi:predicted nucleic acid-binding protein
MNEPILADTSVWINFFNGTESPEVKILTDYIQNDYPVYLCPVIIQEILQGIADEDHFHDIKEYLLAFPILQNDAVDMAIAAATLYRSLRKKGITIRKSNDCLIAQYAIQHSLKVLHQDRDFDLIFDHL